MTRASTFTVLLLLLGCPPTPGPYALVLWSDSPLLNDGEVYPLTDRRESADGTQRQLLTPGGERVWTDAWRVMEFPTLSQAQDHQPLVLERRQTRALGSRLWSRPDPYSELVTVLGVGKEIRVLSLAHSGNGRTVSWTEALAEEGSRGWIPTYMLEPAATALPLRTLAGLVDAGPWKPGFFDTMVQSGLISLTALREDLGLTLAPEEGRMTLLFLRDSEVVREDYRFQHVNETSDALGFFLFEGSIPFRIQWIRDQDLTLFLPRGEAEEIQSFVSFKGDADRQNRLSAAIVQEWAARNLHWEALSRISPTWRSAAYGILELKPGGGFRWEGPDRLLPYLRQLLHPISKPSQDNGVTFPPERMSPWFAPGTYGGYEWKGSAGFDLFAPLPPKTSPVVRGEGNISRGILLQLERVGSGLPFAVGLERNRNEVKGLVLVALSPLGFGFEGAVVESLPEDPITLYFEPSLDE